MQLISFTIISICGWSFWKKVIIIHFPFNFLHDSNRMARYTIINFSDGFEVVPIEWVEEEKFDVGDTVQVALPANEKLRALSNKAASPSSAWLSYEGKVLKVCC